MSTSAWGATGGVTRATDCAMKDVARSKVFKEMCIVQVCRLEKGKSMGGGCDVDRKEVLRKHVDLYLHFGGQDVTLALMGKEV
jgi:hypothetical protein